MRAATGAIERISIKEDGDVEFLTIGECEPQGICGSGLIDAIAQMLDSKLISKTGRLISADDADRKKLAPGFKERLCEIDSQRCFVLVSKESGEDIYITQNDIREIQLAKGAIAAGIQLMLGKMGKAAEDIECVVIAGAFGNYIDKASAVRIGVLPDVGMDRIISAGNTAGAGIVDGTGIGKGNETGRKCGFRDKACGSGCNGRIPEHISGCNGIPADINDKGWHVPYHRHGERIGWIT